MAQLPTHERVRRYAQKPARLVVGLMSGTSADGIDAALVRVSGSGRATRVKLHAFVIVPFEPLVRRQVLQVSDGDGNAAAVSALNFALGAVFADAAHTLLETAGVAPDDVDLVASHGQTVSHTPLGGATLQIGEAAVIAERLGVPVVSDFRTADVAAGGQGAPLVPYADWCLLTHATKTRAIQNLGGVGNVTYLRSDAAPDDILGFDTGPGNLLLDQAAAWASKDWPPDARLFFDEDGALGAKGRVDAALLDRGLRHPFLGLAPPKSAGREQFGETFWRDLLSDAQGRSLRAEDVAATMTALTAHSVADAYRRFLPAPPDEVIVGGGGARNPTLMRMLAERLAPIPVRTHEDIGLNSDAKEAVAFAVLANETMLGRPSNLPSVTGARRPVVLGKLTVS